ncbi:ATP-binding protein [Candidatus Micrarchaeota archaeon]|nr:ATP-binding protein [Candidatus Micrarchaeota archaeon]MBU1165320.1 ATP-binding protein [Candidatus Micrarchaeota archaeon]MBU1887115.1 ATP-binding protein [Candidatus Micrarchaeota archaeon]
MIGPNPFIVSDDDIEKTYGRKEELRIFDAFLNNISSGQPRIILVSGVPGVGKTRLMHMFAHLAEKNRIVALYVKIQKGEDNKKILERMGKEFGMLHQIRLDARSFNEFVEKIGYLGEFGTVIFIDDIDVSKNPDEIVKKIELLVSSGKLKNKKIGFVIGATADFKPVPEYANNVRLRGFNEHDFKEFLSKTLSEKSLKPGEEFVNVILNDSDGNPRIIRGVCRHIYDKIRDDEKILTKGHYLAYLPHIMNMFSREWFGEIYQKTPDAERKIMKILAKNPEGMRVSEIAVINKKPIGQITALTKRLLEKGYIVKIERGKYKIFAKLYGKYVLRMD